MPSYLFTYRTPRDYVPGNADTMKAWMAFFDGIGSAVEDMGNPVFSRETTGDTGAETVLGGYSMVSAGSLQEALSLAAGCPLLALGGGVEVGEITPLSAEMPASTAGSAAIA